MFNKSDLPSPKDYWLLGLEADAPRDLVKKAYIAFVKTWHPDRFPQGSRQQRQAEEKLKNINAAYRRIRNAWTSDIPGRDRENVRAEEPWVYPPDGGHTREDATAPRTASFRPWQIVGKIWRILHAAVPQNPGERRRAFGIVMFFVLTVSILGVMTKVRPFAFIDDRRDQFQQARIAPPATDRAPPSPSEATLPPEPSEVTMPPQSFVSVAIPGNDPPAAEAGEASSSRPFFTLGSSKKEVLRVQGKPSKVYGQTWVYGLSDVTFKEGKVWRYHNFDGTLLVQIVPSPSSPDDIIPQLFSLGSSKEEVVRVQGVPTRVEGNKWSYGFSEIYFRDGVVVGFNNFFNSLKVTMLPSGDAGASSPQDYFTIGSTRDEVLAVQGTPTIVQGNMWSYQLSEVLFADDRVRSVSNLSGNLQFVPPDMKTVH